jgi:hypothetical protein
MRHICRRVAICRIIASRLRTQRPAEICRGPKRSEETQSASRTGRRVDRAGTGRRVDEPELEDAWTSQNWKTRGASQNWKTRGRAGTGSGAPGQGAATKSPRQAWLPSVHLLCHPGWPLPTWPGLTRLPRLVARGYLAAVPGHCCVRTTFLRRSCVRTTFLRRNRQPEKPHHVTNS